MRIPSKCIKILIFAILSLLPLSALSSPIDQMHYNQMSPSDFFADKDGNIYFIKDSNLYMKSHIFGETWGVKVANISTAAIDPKDSNTIYAINTKNLLIKTVDGGKTWIDLKPIPKANVSLSAIFISPHNNQEILLATAVVAHPVPWTQDKTYAATFN